MDEYKISLEALRPHLLYQFKNEAELLKAVEEVGKIFNFFRENLEKYRNDERLVSAYCAYYLTTNYPKLFETIKLLEPGFNLGDFERIIDIGTGPGTFLLALHKLLKAETELIGVDTSSLMLRQASKITQGFCPERNIILSETLKSAPSKRSLLIFTHSLNEMPLKNAFDYVEKSQADAILLIEPGTKESFSKALELRKWCLQKGYNVAYPCFSNAECPLNPEVDWCHQFIQVKHSQDVESMTQKLGRDRKLLPLTAQLYVKDPVKKDSEAARIVRVYRPTKHSVEWMLCKEINGGNLTFDVEVPKRGLSKKEIKGLESVMAGEKVHYSVVKEMENKTRIRCHDTFAT